jgi:hypothetical protein
MLFQFFVVNYGLHVHFQVKFPTTHTVDKKESCLWCIKVRMALQDRKRQIAELAGTEALYRGNCEIIQNDIDDLFNERRQLQQFVFWFKNSNRIHAEIKSVEEIVIDF